MSPQQGKSEPASLLRFGRTKKLQNGLLTFLNQYEGATVLDLLVFLTIAENENLSPPQYAEDLGCPLPRFKHTMYGLEQGRSDNRAKAMQLIEVHSNATPGFRNQKMLRLSDKGKRLYAQIAAGE